MPVKVIFRLPLELEKNFEKKKFDFTFFQSDERLNEARMHNKSFSIENHLRHFNFNFWILIAFFHFLFDYVTTFFVFGIRKYANHVRLKFRIEMIKRLRCGWYWLIFFFYPFRWIFIVLGRKETGKIIHSMIARGYSHLE